MTIIGLYNRDKSKMAFASAYPGVEGGYFSFFKVQKPDAKPPATTFVFPADHLMTERGIRLGVPERFVTTRLGFCFTRETAKGGDVYLNYHIGYNAHPLLKRGQARSYSARYGFRHGRLVSIILWL